MERLGKYPRWKIEKLDEYVGSLNNRVFQYLDELVPPPVSVADVLDVFKDIGSRAQLTSENKDLAKASLAHIKKLVALDKPKNEAEAEANWEAEKASLLGLHREFRHLGLIPSFSDILEMREKDQDTRRTRAKEQREAKNAESRIAAAAVLAAITAKDKEK